MPDVWIPPMMQRLTGGAQRVQVHGSSVRQVVENLERAYPGIRALLYDEGGNRLRPDIAVIVDGEVSALRLLERVEEASEVHFLPAISGGSL